MKIAFLTSEFPHPKTGSSGGIGTSIMNLSQGLVLAGHQVTLLIYNQDKDEVFEENGIIFHKIKNVKVKGFSRFFTQKKIENLINVLVKKQKIDLVEAADWTGITSFIQPNCPIIIRLHGSDTYFCHLDNRPVKWINRFHENRALQKATALLSVSQFTADLTKELFALKKDFTIIPNGIDTKKFDGFPENDATQNYTILYFGTLIRKKGLLELPLIFNEVYAKNNHAKLILAGKDASDILTGSPSVWQMMQPLFTNEALQNVSYLGIVSYEAIRKIIKDAAVCVFPTFAEALPVSWIEAMAMQKAVVASNIGWAVEIIDDGTDGFLVHPKDHSEYAAKISELLLNRELQRQFGAAARKKVIKKFTNEVVAKQSADFYKTLIS
ncbi:MAG TPA: glycosyltransferase family 4 protein [Flavobacterium sp.]|nr:glycosyltransferase family 4 protein [Flavobacterium sp.]